MEPERKIEKLLRTYARKRRADTGDPLNLHPAARRILQDEVARNAPKPGRQNSFVSLWELFQRRPALVTGLALVFLAGTIFFLQALNPAPKKLSTLTAISSARPDSEPTNPGLPELVAVNDSPRRELPEAAASLKDADSIAAVAPLNSVQPKLENGWSETRLADPSPATATAGTLAANAPAAAPPAVDRLAKEADALDKDFKTQSKTVQFASSAEQNFQNNNLGAQNSFKNTITQKKAGAVLANFQVQQSGSAIRVVDADGSVYDGALQPENAVTQKERTYTVAGSLPVGREKSNARRDETQMAQNYSFRVTGTNLTLKQNVVFAGNLVADSSATAKGQQANNRNVSFDGGGAGGQVQSALTNQLPWSNSRIAGTAVVADTNSVEIDAVPQSP